MGGNWSESRMAEREAELRMEMLDTSSSEEEDVSDDEDLVKSSEVVRATQSQESNDSDVSLKSDGSE